MLKRIDGHGLNARAVFRAESMSLNLSERDSTSAVTVASNAGTIQTGEWVQDLEDPGKGIVWRVRSIDDQRDTRTRTINLEHVINTLKDRIIPTEVKTTDISGSSTATARQAINKILSYQSDWVLGAFDYDAVSNPYHFDGETLKAALETVTSSLEDPVWGYDFSTYPFKLDIRRLAAEPDSELRGGRNLTTIKISEDRSQMYTRFYPRGKNNLKLSGGGYVEKNTSRYGVIEKTETDSAKESEAELISWGNDRLARHARPGHTVTISGLELSASTGEKLDRLTIGHKCQVPLPEDGEVVTEKITKLAWRDKIKDPTGVTITLADALDDVASIVKEEQSKSGGGSRAAAKADEGNELLIGSVEDNMYSVIAQTSTYILHAVFDEAGFTTIEQTASQITLAVSTASTEMWSTIQQTATGIVSTVGTMLGDYSTIAQTATSIHLAVSNATTDFYSAIDIQKNRISLVVQGSGANASIKPAAIVAAINDGASSIKLSADHIDIDGLVSSLEAVDVMVQNFNANDGEFTGDVSILGTLNVVDIGTVNGYGTGWRSANLMSYTLGTYRYYLYGTSTSSTTASGATGMYPVTGSSSSTIYYLGHS